MMSDGAVRFRYQQLNGAWQAIEGEVIEEGLVSIFVNGQELATVMCSPRDQDKLALGFLRNEGLIDGLADVRNVTVCPSGVCVDVWLTRADFEPPRRMILTSGCGGGVTFDDLSQTLAPLDVTLTLAPEQLAEMMNQLQTRDSLYARAGGVHTSGLSDGERILVWAEDVGRHNSVDKVRGACLQSGLDPRGLALLCTGRISSEMLRKAASMGCPIVASRTSPTSLAVQLAQAWNITLCGYVRRGMINVYAHSERLQAEV
jgi:FdhD protein